MKNNGNGADSHKNADIGRNSDNGCGHYSNDAYGRTAIDYYSNDGHRNAAIITGGSRGIGYAIARRLAKDGFNVAIMATRAPETFRERAEELSALGAECLYVQGSVRDARARQRFVEETVERFGGVYALVNNAGIGPRVRCDLLDMSEESWDEVVDTNLKSAMFLTQLAARQMLRQPPIKAGGKRGTIVNVSSCSAAVSSTNRGEYCVSKAGMSMLTLLFADRLARDGVYVHEVRPGIIDTDMTSGAHAKYDALIEAGAFPIARWGTPEDVAAAVSAFVGDAFLYTTGNYVDIDGGFHIRRL